MSDIIDFKTKTLIKNKEEHYRIIKWIIQQGDITIVIFFNQIGTSKCIKHLITIRKELINNNKIILEEFNTTFTIMDRSLNQKIKQEIMNFNNMLE